MLNGCTHGLNVFNTHDTAFPTSVTTSGCFYHTVKFCFMFGVYMVLETTLNGSGKCRLRSLQVSNKPTANGPENKGTLFPFFFFFLLCLNKNILNYHTSLTTAFVKHHTPEVVFSFPLRCEGVTQSFR